MSAQVIAFPKRHAPDISSRAADEHVLVALAHRDALLTDPAIAQSYADFRCVQAGLDGLAHFIRTSYPRLPEAGVADYLRTVLAYYCRDTLKVGE